ncbi:MAG: UxaA family hydrolase [Clostridium sp.]|nr:UxaA family hydrolase [Clostridium sp.]
MNGLLIDGMDNVAVVTCPVERGMDVSFMKNQSQCQVKAGTPVPVYHKIAICDIGAGESVVKYGHVIGKATRLIKAGEHVHCHNAASAEERRNV